MKTNDSKVTKKCIAHLFEDPKTGILWLSECSLDETGLVTTARGELDLTKCKAVDAEYISYNHFGMCLVYDLITVRNSKGLYSILTPFHATKGNGAIFASIYKGFAFKTAYGFSIPHPHCFFPTIYVLAETATGEWGIIRIAVSNNIWRDYYDDDKLSFSLPQVIVPFEKKSMQEALEKSGLAIPVASIVTCWQSELGYLRDLTKRNVDPLESFGITIDDMLRVRYNKEQVESLDSNEEGGRRCIRNDSQW